MNSGVWRAGWPGRLLLAAVVDLFWLLGNAAAATTNEQAKRWQPLLSMAYDPTRSEHQAALATVLDASPLYREVVHWLLHPPSPPPRRRPTRNTAPTREEIQVLLVDTLTNDADEAFADLSFVAEFEPGQRFSTTSLYPRITSLPGVGVAHR